MVTTSRIDIDSRIQNEAEALSCDYDVTIICRKYPHIETLKNTPYKVKRIAYKELKPYKLGILSSILALAQAVGQEEADYYHAHDLDGLLATYRTARKQKKPLIYDSHELWAENSANARLKGIGWVMPILEKYLIKFVTAGIATSLSTTQELKLRYDKDFVLVRNMPKLTDLKPSKVDFHKLYPGEIVIVHAGQIGPSRGISQMVSAMKYLPIDFTLVFLGGKSNPALDSQIINEDLTKRVHILREVPPTELVSALKTADLGIVMTEGLTKSKYFSLPNKLLQYMAAEIPVVASDIPEHRRIIAQEKIGELTDVEPKKIAQKILNVFKEKNLKTYKQNLKGLSSRAYSWDIESKKLVNFYDKFSQFVWL